MTSASPPDPAAARRAGVPWIAAFYEPRTVSVQYVVPGVVRN